jgi:hypothetical protein
MVYDPGVNVFAGMTMLAAPLVSVVAAEV